MKNGKELRLRKDVTKDSADNMTVVIFQSLIEKLSNLNKLNQTYSNVMRATMSLHKVFVDPKKTQR